VRGLVRAGRLKNDRPSEERNAELLIAASERLGREVTKLDEVTEPEIAELASVYGAGLTWRRAAWERRPGE